jgi:hypothetical protein
MPPLDFSLQPALTLRGMVVDPDGKPLTGVKVTGLSALPDYDEMLEGASFTVTGLNPVRSRDLFFYHRGKALGRVLTVRGDEAQSLMVQLQPCGWVIGRIVNREGKPVPGLRLHFFSDAAVETDGDGRFRAALVPGQKFGLALTYPHSLLRNMGALEVESGQTKDLGEQTLAD